MKLALGALLLFVAPVMTLADSVQDVAQYLDANTSLPFAAGVDVQLAGNLLQAQALASYASPTSLLLSENAVLKAVSLYVWPGGPAAITSESEEPVVWAQSRVAIDPNATVSLDPGTIDFGQVPVPEPPVWTMCLAALTTFSWLWMRRRPSNAQA
jgi:uncharacterized protein (TIGR03382 family)